MWFYLHLANLILAWNSTKSAPLNGHYPKLQFPTYTWFSHAQSHICCFERIACTDEKKVYLFPPLPEWWAHTDSMNWRVKPSVQDCVQVPVEVCAGIQKTTVKIAWMSLPANWTLWDIKKKNPNFEISKYRPPFLTSSWQKNLIIVDDNVRLDLFIARCNVLWNACCFERIACADEKKSVPIPPFTQMMSAYEFNELKGEAFSTRLRVGRPVKVCSGISKRRKNCAEVIAGKLNAVGHREKET